MRDHKWSDSGWNSNDDLDGDLMGTINFNRFVYIARIPYYYLHFR